MNDFNIEFAHIYADENFGEEQIKSISRLKKIQEELIKKKKSFVKVVLVDEYSPILNTLEDNDFLNNLKERGIHPDFLVHESDLSEIAKDVISLIPKNLIKKEKFKSGENSLLVKDNKKIGLINSSGKFTCSILVAAWILVRFGIYNLHSIKKFSNKNFEAKGLITILPQKYKKTEQKVLDILETTKYKNLIKNIKYEFF